ncbi:MAG: lysophospholipase L1-like esterase, partial [Yoonia sp.]
AVVRAARSKVPGAQIVLMKVFPRGEKPNHPARSKIAAINKLLPAIAQELKVELLDITDELLDENGVFPKSRAQDFLHPSDEGYKIWAQALKPFLPAR